MIENPINDRKCLSGITDVIRQLVAQRDAALVGIAERVGTTRGLVEWIRTSSSGAAHRWAPNGLSAVTVTRSSCFSVSGRRAISSRPPASAGDSTPAASSFAR